MVTVEVISSDCRVWNRDQVIIDISYAMSLDDDIIIDLVNEGPCFESLDLLELINQIRDLYSYRKNIKVLTCNLAQSECQGYSFDTAFPYHFIKNIKDRLVRSNLPKNITKAFGMFIGRSNAPRLDLASYMRKKYNDKTLMTYHFDVEIDYHRDNIGLDNIVRWQNTTELSDAVDFLNQCPLKFENVRYPILMDQHCDIDYLYNNFLLEIVCETYYTGKTFFPTEKIWRPIAMKSPFVVQGPRYFLHRLKDLGFRTFDHWWDEGYSEDPANWQIVEIKKVIDDIATVDTNTLDKWYHEMAPILDHNRSRLFELSEQELKFFYKNCSRYD